jgi:hypothetical protein
MANPITKIKKTTQHTASSIQYIHTTESLHPPCQITIRGNTYIFKDVVGIGNCAYEAIIASGKLLNINAQQLRQKTHRYATTHNTGKKIVEATHQYYIDPETLEEYIHRMQMNREWAGAFEMTLIAFMYNINIVITTQNQNHFTHDIKKWANETFPQLAFNPTDTINILHHTMGRPQSTYSRGHNHFGVLFQIKNPTSNQSVQQLNEEIQKLINEQQKYQGNAEEPQIETNRLQKPHKRRSNTNENAQMPATKRLKQSHITEYIQKSTSNATPPPPDQRTTKKDSKPSKAAQTKITAYSAGTLKTAHRARTN